MLDGSVSTFAYSFRPGVKEFLQRMSDRCNIVIFSALKQENIEVQAQALETLVEIDLPYIFGSEYLPSQAHLMRNRHLMSTIGAKEGTYVAIGCFY